MNSTSPETFSISGIVPPVVTPLLDRDTLDVEGAKRLVEHMIAGGVSGLFILGTTGEAPSLSYRLRREYIELVCGIAEKRVPVLVGITDTSFVESVTLAKFAKASGADAVVLSTPYYFPAGQTELTQYVSHIVEELPLPLMLYNMPSLTKVWFEIESLEKLTTHKNIVGVKDSSGDLDYFKRLVELRKLRPDWSFMVGPEHLLIEALKLGGDGGVNGGANAFPELFVGCYNAYQDKDDQQATKYLECIEALQEVYSVGKYASRHIKATKCVLSLLKICDDKMAEPFNHFLPPEREKVNQILQKIAPGFDSIGLSQYGSN